MLQFCSIGAADPGDYETTMTTQSAATGSCLSTEKPALLEALFMRLPDGVAINELLFAKDGTPENYRFLDINTQFGARVGLVRNSTIGQLATIAYNVEAAPNLKDFAAIVRSGLSRTVELTVAPHNLRLNVSVVPLEGNLFATVISRETARLTIDAPLLREGADFCRIFELSPIPISIMRLSGEILAVNHAFCSLSEYSHSELVGQHATALRLWEPSSLRNEAMTQLMRDGRFDSLPIALMSKKGKRKRLELSGNLVEVDGSRAVITTALDITERSQAEAQLRDSEERFRILFQLSPTPMAIAALDGLRLVELNRAYSVAVGVSRAELLATRAQCHFLSSPSVLQSSSDPHKSGGRIEDIEVEFMRPGDIQRLYRISGRLVQHAGQPHIMVSAIDITQLRAAERVAARSHDQLVRVSELAQIGYFSANVETQKVQWTAELCRIFGRSPSEFLPTFSSIQEAVLAEDLAEAAAVAVSAIEARTWRRVSFRIRRPNGELRHCLAVIEGTEPCAEHPYHLHGLVQDLTELKNAEADRISLEQQVMQAQKLESLGVLAGGIAHDFNNLLTSILGNADLALGELPSKSPVRAYISDIELVSRRAADLCRQMLAYSGKGRFVIQSLSINRLVEEMAHLLNVSISKKATLEYRLDDTISNVLADAAQLRQVVMNLIINASEALGTQCGTIALTTGQVDRSEQDFSPVPNQALAAPFGSYVFLEVRDTGCGMDKETLDKIFDPFFTTKFTGRGLGLAAVQGIIRGHKGFTQIRSEVGKGTSFRVFFPAHPDTASASPVAATRQEPWQGKGLVLLVDDEQAIRQMGRQMLERAGFRVLTAANGREAVDRFDAHKSEICLVVLDLTMPQLDGEACVGELRKLDPKVKVIMTSGYSEQDIVGRFADWELSGFVQKPYTTAELIPKIREALEGPPASAERTA